MTVTSPLTNSSGQSVSINQSCQRVRETLSSGRSFEVLHESAENYVKNKKVVNAAVFIMRSVCENRRMQHLSDQGNLTFSCKLNYKNPKELHGLTRKQTETLQLIITSLFQESGYDCVIQKKTISKPSGETPKTKMQIKISLSDEGVQEVLKNQNWEEKAQREANRVECIRLEEQLRLEKEKNDRIMETVANWRKELETLLECPVALDRLENPVITPGGYTYSRNELVQHLERNPSDPMDRSAVGVDQLYPNRFARDVIEKLDELGIKLHSD